MKTPSTVGSVKSTPRKMNDVSTSKSKRKIDLSAIVEEENDTELPDIFLGCFLPDFLSIFFLLFFERALKLTNLFFLIASKPMLILAAKIW
jgi:hypothetical protein